MTYPFHPLSPIDPNDEDTKIHTLGFVTESLNQRFTSSLDLISQWILDCLCNCVYDISPFCSKSAVILNRLFWIWANKPGPVLLTAFPPATPHCPQSGQPDSGVVETRKENEGRCPPENFLWFYWLKFFSLCLHWLVFQVDSGPKFPFVCGSTAGMHDSRFTKSSSHSLGCTLLRYLHICSFYWSDLKYYVHLLGINIWDNGSLAQ